MMLWLLAPLAIIVAVDAWNTYANVQKTARLIQDRMLLASARTIAEQVTLIDGDPVVDIPPAALEMLNSGAEDRVWYRVSTTDGILLAGSNDLPMPNKTIHAEQSHAYTIHMGGENAEAVAFSQPVFGSARLESVVVIVAQTMQERDGLVMRLLPRAMRDQVLMLLLGAALIWIGLRFGLAPIRALRTAMSDRDHSALDPVESRGIPSELKPLIVTLNEYIARLRAHMEGHSRFIADASHQLRTPLAVMNTQVAFGLRESGVEAKDETLAALRDSLRGNIRLVNQLLSYTEAEAGNRNTDTAPSDLQQGARRVIEDLVMLAQSRQIDLGFECGPGDRPHPVALSEHAVHVMVSNLVDNALRYTQAGGQVTVRLSQDDNHEWLEVADNGPGIPADQRERVFERFVRLNDDEIDGCGLGLAIVREIAASCGARISLDENGNGRGLRVRVRFPRWTATEITDPLR